METNFECLTAKQRPIFLFFGFLALAVFLNSASLFWYGFIEKLPLKEIGWSKIFVLSACTVIIIYLMTKYKFLRPRFEKKAPFIMVLRIINCIAEFFCTMLLGVMVMHLLLMKGPMEKVCVEVAIFLSLAFCISIIEKILIPTAKIKLRQKN
jgi:hypothetical protein